TIEIITFSGCHRWITQQRRARRVFRMSAINDRLALRIAAIFVILVTSILGTLFPVLTRQSQRVSVPPWVYEAVKYFGSGVILATALIHLQAPASESLSSPCLSAGWSLYPFSQGITLASIFAIFIIEIIAIRVGTSRLAALGLKYCAHGINADQSPAEDAKTPSASGALDTTQPSALRLESNLDKFSEETATTRAGVPSAEVCSQLIGAAILELGVIFHSIVIGLTLAVNEQFTTFFLVIIFHRKVYSLFLARATPNQTAHVPHSFVTFFPFRNAQDCPNCHFRTGSDDYPSGVVWLYSFVTPLGLALGLALRNTYNPNSATALIVSGCLDSFSAGILLYTGLVELLAHDFIFNKTLLLEHSNTRLTFDIGCVVAGAGQIDGPTGSMGMISQTQVANAAEILARRPSLSNHQTRLDPSAIQYLVNCNRYPSKIPSLFWKQSLASVSLQPIRRSFRNHKLFFLSSAGLTYPKRIHHAVLLSQGDQPNRNSIIPNYHPFRLQSILASLYTTDSN
ncbi:hypothetical protein PSHT_12645, partial [Puccinia striiformis]